MKILLLIINWNPLWMIKSKLNKKSANIKISIFILLRPKTHKKNKKNRPISIYFKSLILIYWWSIVGFDFLHILVLPYYVQKFVPILIKLN